MNDSPVLKSYKRKDVDEFLIRLNEAQLKALSEKDDEIKRLFSECEFYKKECEKKDGEITSIKAEYEDMLEKKQKETDMVNARLGEKLSAAENAATAIIAEAKTERERLLFIAKAEAESYAVKAKAKAEEYCEQAKQLSLVYREHFSKANQSLEVMNKHLDTALEEMAKLISGN